MHFLILAFAMLATHSAKAAEPQQMNGFIRRLMSRMTLEEKAGQLSQYTAEMSVTGASIKENYRKEIELGKVGSVFNAFTPKFTRQLQTLAVEKSRLKIPLLFAYDVIHGHRTIFPIPLGESSSWDLELMEQSARVAAEEAAADGIHWTFAPMADIARDPRWGRSSEGAGEDPFLGGKIARVKVRGLQGEKPGELDHVLACVKHFAAYGAVQGGRDYNSVQLTDRELLETYLPPYEEAVKAGVATVMPSFNDIGGVPSTANTWLLKKILRDKWKFDGMVVTDYTAIPEMVNHGVAEDDKAAALLAIKAGIDMDMQGAAYIRYLPELVKEGKIPMRVVNEAVRRVLELKYKLGLFADPYRYSDEKRAEKVLFSEKNRNIARNVARRSIVLLKNENSILPLKKSGTIALIGPFVDDHRDLIGNWSAAGDYLKTVSLREGFTRAAGDQVRVVYALGANLIEASPLLDKLNKRGGEIHLDSRPKQELIDEAVRVAKKADVVVLALGEPQSMSGEAASRTRIRLPENQQDLLKALKEKTDKPIVLLLANGRPLVLTDESKTADAILETWFLGTESGNAIADVLFGEHNPSARLTMSFPVNEGQIPVYYSARTTGRPFEEDNWYSSKYLDAPNEPLYPFGYGLSYTKFNYSAPKLSAEKLKPGEKLRVTVTVTNSGMVDGEDTVQLYIRDLVASVSRPAKVLRGFEKVFLRKGESREVTFELSDEDLKFYNQDLDWVAEPGKFKVFVGGNSRDTQEASFNLVKK